MAILKASRAKRHTAVGSRRWRRLTAWAGVLALVLQVFVPYVHQPASAASSDFPWDISDFCLLSGHLPPGYGPASDKDGPGTPQDHKIPACSICKTLQQIGHYLPPAATPIAKRPDAGVPVRFASLVFVAAKRTASNSQPRAPPVLV